MVIPLLLVLIPAGNNNDDDISHLLFWGCKPPATYHCNIIYLIKFFIYKTCLLSFIFVISIQPLNKVTVIKFV